MSTAASDLALPSHLLKQIAAAPHRLLFFIGATNVLCAMTWWMLWLANARWSIVSMQSAAISAGWMHAMVMQYQVLPSFIFGFLLTVFPRWMNQPPLTRWHYVPVGIGLFGGQIATLCSLIAGVPLLKVGAALTFAGWLTGTALLLRLVYRDGAKTWHALSCVFALSFGLLGLTLYGIFLNQFDARLIFTAIKLGSIVVLLPIYFTVCHRMIPFFAAAALPGYSAPRPLWALGAMWASALLHVWLELRHGYAWLWIADLPLVVVSGYLLNLWWPRERAMPGLLSVLMVGFAWLPLAFALYSVQSIWYAIEGNFVLGRAPAHALFIGFFGSLLVAMVTRVTQGHSGRPLILGKIAGFAFVIVQVCAVVRIVAEIVTDSLAWQSIAAGLWLIAFVPWVVRSLWIYSTPRTDGKSG
jgi:uncharacterized protein involved in response to NO